MAGRWDELPVGANCQFARHAGNVLPRGMMLMGWGQAGTQETKVGTDESRLFVLNIDSCGLFYIRTRAETPNERP